MAGRVAAAGASVDAALTEFDAAFPGPPDLEGAGRQLMRDGEALKRMRDIAEHIDEYAVDAPRRHDNQVDRMMLGSGMWDATTFHWLGVELNIDVARSAAEQLLADLQPALLARAIPSS